MASAYTVASEESLGVAHMDSIAPVDISPPCPSNGPRLYGSKWGISWCPWSLRVLPHGVTVVPRDVLRSSTRFWEPVAPSLTRIGTRGRQRSCFYPYWQFVHFIGA